MLVPVTSGLRPDGAGVAERHAFGAMAVAPVADRARMGCLIVAAFQRAKFGAIVDLFDLWDPGTPEARSVGHQLEEAYVDLAIGDAGDAIEALADHAGLTSQGRRFVMEMRRSAQSMGHV